MRFMGLDVGDKRIGVAISDESALIASPRETLSRTGNKKDIAHLLELARREEVSEILVGMPWRLDGTSGPQADKVSRFVDALRASTEIAITTWDERFSTVRAEEALIEADVSREKRRGVVDKVAAAIILQSYLDAKRAARADGEGTGP
jgi:putative Holliday junction resolvase